MDDVDIMKKKRILMACRDIMLNEYAESEVAEEIIADIKKFTNFTANDFFIVKKIIFNYFQTNYMDINYSSKLHFLAFYNRLRFIFFKD